MNKINKYEFIECVIPASSSNTRFYFNDQPQLRFVSLNQLECYNETAVPFSILSGNANISAQNFAKAFLVLYYDDKESTNRIPLTLLNPVSSNVSPTTAAVGTNYPSVFGVKTYNGQQVQWSKSYVQFVNASTLAGSINSVCFGVYYS
jgi:hypothetical protein